MCHNVIPVPQRSETPWRGQKRVDLAPHRTLFHPASVVPRAQRSVMCRNARKRPGSLRWSAATPRQRCTRASRNPRKRHRTNLLTVGSASSGHGKLPERWQQPPNPKAPSHLLADAAFAPSSSRTKPRTYRICRTFRFHPMPCRQSARSAQAAPPDKPVPRKPHERRNWPRLVGKDGESSGANTALEPLLLK